MLRKILVYSLVGLAVIVAGVVALIGFVRLGFSGPLPSAADLQELRRPQTTEVYASDGAILGRLFEQNRSDIPFEDLPASLVDALIATEDARFYRHHGIDYRSFLRVLFKGILLSSSSAGGGSTLSQQLAKNLFPRQNYLVFSTPVNKIREMIIARRIERVYSKEQIIEHYLNTVSFGELAFGIGTGARRFFDKSVSALLPEESALLVGMLKAPTYYSPRRSPEKAVARRNVVFGQMVRYEKITEKAGDSLSALPLELTYTPDTRPSELSGYILSHVEKQAQEILSEQNPREEDPINIRVSGLRIYTTIDSRMQKEAEDAVRAQMPVIQGRFDKEWGSKADWETTQWATAAMSRIPAFKQLREEGKTPEEAMKALEEKSEISVFSWNEEARTRKMSVLDSLKYYRRLLQTGLLSIDPASGDIKAWVGGIDHRYFPYDHVLARRQAGSTFKPIYYAAALESGIKPCHYYDNSRTVFATHDDWSPQNADGHYGGSYSLQGALVNSVNTVAVQVLNDVGIPAAIGMARRLGIASDIPSVPSIALGSAELRLDELTAAYCAFTNGGYYHPPECITRITDNKGAVLYERQMPDQPAQVLPDSVALTMLRTLEMVVDSGTAQALRTVVGLKIPLAGKTGTTQHYTDGWFICISPGLVTGVWVGADDPQVHFKSGNGAGGRTALQVYSAFIAKAHKFVANPVFPTHTEEKGPACPLYSDLKAQEIEALLRREEEQGDWFLPNLFESIFSGKKEDRASAEQRILRQMQDKLDKTAVKMRKKRRSPMEISRALDEIRKEYYRRLEKMREEDN